MDLRRFPCHRLGTPVPGWPGLLLLPILQVLLDIGHIVYFVLFAGLLSRWGPVSRMSLAWQWTIILVVTLLLGVSIEFMQHGTARTPDTGDVLRDLTGSFLVLVFGSLGSKLQPARWRLFLQFSALVLLLVQLWPAT